MTLGEKIITLRKTQKLSQGDLAEKLNVSRQSVSKWETDASVPELNKLIMISNLFNVSLDELVKSDVDSPAKQTERQTDAYHNNQYNTHKITLPFKKIRLRPKKVQVSLKYSFKYPHISGHTVKHNIS